MNQAPEPQTDILAAAIEQLYENERLTDALTDEAARNLLSWGEQWLKNLAASLNPASIDRAAYDLQQLMRSINRLAAQRAELAETEFVQRLFNLVEQAWQLQPHLLSNEQVTADDEKNQEFK